MNTISIIQAQAHLSAILDASDLGAWWAWRVAPPAPGKHPEPPRGRRMLLETSPLGSDALVVVVRADHLDASTAPVFREATVGLDPGRRFVVVDLSAVRFVDSSGLSGLLALQRHLFSRNVRLSVCGLTRTVQALFELMQVERLMEIFDTREAAALHFATLGEK